MKKKCRILVLCLLSLCLFVLCLACNKSIKINHYEYNEDSFSYIEKYSAINKVYQSQKTTTEYADYYFVESVSQNDRDVFVTHAELLIEYMVSEKLPYVEIDSDKVITFYVSYDFYTRSDSDNNSIYFNYSDYNSINLVNYTLQAIVGETVNFGLLYGLSAKIYQELPWGKISTENNSNIKKFLQNENNRYVLDLTYGVFHSKFSSNNNIKYAESISVELVDYINSKHDNHNIIYKTLIDANSEFNSSFDTMFYGYLNEYLNSIGISNKAIDVVLFRFASYTKDYPIRFSTLSCDYYINKEWTETEIQKIYPFFNFTYNYQSVKNYLGTSESYLKKTREFFEYNDVRKPYVLIKFLDGGIGGKADISGEILLHSISAITHEYAHILTGFKYGYYSSWMVEGLANYCHYKFDDMFIGQERYTYENYDTLVESEVGKAVYRKYKSYFENFDMENLAFCYSFVTCYEFGREIDLYNYTTAAGYSYYLVNKYGKDKYLDCYPRWADPSYSYGKDQKELIEEYKSFLLNMFK